MALLSASRGYPHKLRGFEKKGIQRRKCFPVSTSRKLVGTWLGRIIPREEIKEESQAPWYEI